MERLLPAQVCTSHSLENQVTNFFQAIAGLNLEGMVAKRKDSHYLPVKRSRAWLKIKHRLETYAVIAGYVPEPFGFKSLVLAQYEDCRLVYVGNVGTGFSEHDKMVLAKGWPESTVIAPGCQTSNSPVAWVKPILVARIAYLNTRQTKTAAGKFSRAVPR